MEEFQLREELVLTEDFEGGRGGGKEDSFPTALEVAARGMSW
ncbi:MAG: hypothetical protein ACP5PX_04620 [Candidatus Hadarchaeum sp.]